MILLFPHAHPAHHHGLHPTHPAHPVMVGLRRASHRSHTSEGGGDIVVTSDQALRFTAGLCAVIALIAVGVWIARRLP